MATINDAGTFVVTVGPNGADRLESFDKADLNFYNKAGVTTAQSPSYFTLSKELLAKPGAKAALRSLHGELSQYISDNGNFKLATASDLLNLRETLEALGVDQGDGKIMFKFWVNDVTKDFLETSQLLPLNLYNGASFFQFPFSNPPTDAEKDKIKSFVQIIKNRFTKATVFDSQDAFNTLGIDLFNFYNVYCKHVVAEADKPAAPEKDEEKKEEKSLAEKIGDGNLKAIEEAGNMPPDAAAEKGVTAALNKKLMDGKDVDVRLAVVAALVGIYAGKPRKAQSHGVTSSLLKALNQDDKPAVKAAVAEALGKIYAGADGFANEDHVIRDLNNVKGEKDPVGAAASKALAAIREAAPKAASLTPEQQAALDKYLKPTATDAGTVELLAVINNPKNGALKTELAKYCVHRAAWTEGEKDAVKQARKVQADVLADAMRGAFTGDAAGLELFATFLGNYGVVVASDFKKYPSTKYSPLPVATPTKIMYTPTNEEPLPIANLVMPSGIFVAKSRFGINPISDAYYKNQSGIYESYYKKENVKLTIGADSKTIQVAIGADTLNGKKLATVKDPKMYVAALGTDGMWHEFEVKFEAKPVEKDTKPAGDKTATEKSAGSKTEEQKKAPARGAPPPEDENQ